MNPDMQEAEGQKAADAARHSVRLMTRSGIAIMALGVVIIFLPSHSSHLVHRITGIFVIVGGLFVIGLGQSIRRRIR
jgi:uncharacterized membrane protein HdeD (DUF308 family)